MANKMDEIIVVARREHLFGENDERAFQGTVVGPEAAPILAGLAGNTELMRRGDAEENPEYKQPIPYGVLTSDDRDGELRIFAYERLKGGGESRLHSKLSIGVGGHMNTLFNSDNVNDVLMDEAKRELTEELVFESVEGEVDVATYPTEIVGLINDELNEVGKVHVGILYTIETSPNHSVEVRETEQLKGDWMTLEELEANDDRLEEWSRIAIQALKQNA